MSKRNRSEQIARRRGQIPRAYRGVYDKAVTGASLRAAVNAQCLECVGWRIREITHCTDVACPLYAVRPYQKSPQNGQEGRVSGAELTNASQGGQRHVQSEND